MKNLKFSGISIVLSFLFVFYSLNAIAQSSEDTSVEMSKSVDAVSFAELDWMPCGDPIAVEGCYITILHGNPAEANSDVLFRLHPGAEVPKHWHNSPERMVLISGEMHVTYEGEETTVLKAGSYAYGPSKKPHYVKCADGEPCVLFIAFEKPVDTYDE